MAKGIIFMLMELSTKATGKMISNMALVWKRGLMGLYMKDSTVKERRTVKAS